jgi:hypothetical protein
LTILAANQLHLPIFNMFSIITVHSLTKKLLSWTIVLKTMALFILLSSTLSCTSYHLVELKRKKIHHFDMVEIGGVKQAIMINGKSHDNPVLVFLHGGPGFPMLPFAPYSESMKELEKQYTIVYWEQRGTGKIF